MAVKPRGGACEGSADVGRPRRPARPRLEPVRPGAASRFRALGLGTLDWPAIVSALIDEGFEKVLYVEHEDVLLPRRQGIMRSLGVLREYLPGGTAEGRTW